MKTKRSALAQPVTLPPIKRWATRDQAYVDLPGRTGRVYLGKWGSKTAEAKYNDLMARWIGEGCPDAGLSDEPSVGTLERLCDLYTDFAAEHYVKAGRKTTSGAKVDIVCALLHEAGFTAMPVELFGPRALKDFREWMVRCGSARWGRATINEYCRVIVAMFQWAVEEQYVPAATHDALAKVAGLRKGRAPAPGLPVPREGRRVTSVNDAAIEAVRSRVPATVRAMIDVQRLTGMRPTEVVGMRRNDLAATTRPEVWAYRVRDDSNKLDHFNIVRLVWLGPRAMEIIRAHWAGDDDFVFSPRRSEEARHAAISITRRSPRWPSHTSEARRARKGPPKLSAGERYSVDSYRRAITRACLAAGIDQWSPNQLRHTTATQMVKREHLTVAKEILGHTDIKTTLMYVDPEQERAIIAAFKHG